MSQSPAKIKHLLETAIDSAIDNRPLDIPGDLPWDIIHEIKRYYRGLNFLTSMPYFDVDIIRIMKKKASETYHIIKRRMDEWQGQEQSPRKNEA